MSMTSTPYKVMILEWALVGNLAAPFQCPLEADFVWVLSICLSE